MQNLQNMQNTKPNLPNLPNLPNQTYQTKPAKPNLPYQIKLSLPSILNQTYQTKITGQSSQRLGPQCLWQCFLQFFYTFSLLYIFLDLDLVLFLSELVCQLELEEGQQTQTCRSYFQVIFLLSKNFASLFQCFFWQKRVSGIHFDVYVISRHCCKSFQTMR